MSGRRVKAIMVVERNKPKVQDVIFACWECGKICKSKGGLVNHQWHMHELLQKRMFRCNECSRDFKKVGGAVALMVEKV